MVYTVREPEHIYYLPTFFLSRSSVLSAHKERHYNVLHNGISRDKVVILKYEPYLLIAYPYKLAFLTHIGKDTAVKQ